MLPLILNGLFTGNFFRKAMTEKLIMAKVINVKKFAMLAILSRSSIAKKIITNMLTTMIARYGVLVFVLTFPNRNGSTFCFAMPYTCRDMVTTSISTVLKVEHSATSARIRKVEFPNACLATSANGAEDALRVFHGMTLKAEIATRI